MPINGVVDSFAAQEMAPAASQIAASQLPEADKKSEDKKIDERSDIQKLLDSKSNSTASKQVLADLISKMAGSGIKLEPEAFISKTKKFIKDEYDLISQRQESASDVIDIKTIGSKVTSSKKSGQNRNGQNGQNKDGNNPIVDPQKLAGTIQEYSNAFAQFIVSGGTNRQKKVEDLELQLRAEGITDKELLGLQQNLRQSIRLQLATQIKESLLKRFLSKEKTLEWVMNDKEAFKSIEFAFNNEKTGGWDFGNYNKSLQGTVDEQLRQIKGEVRDFVKDELQLAALRKHLKVDTADAEMKRLIEVGSKAQVNFNQFMKNWEKTIINIGLVPVPPQALSQSMIGSGLGEGKRENTGYEYTQDDEKDLLINQLRTLYIKRAVYGDMRTKLETSFKIRKLKNGLIKLGVSFGDVENIENEGKTLGRVKVLEMLKETFLEKATLYELAGPAFNLIENKIKGLIKNLEKLGIVLSKAEVDSIRDKANLRMFDIARDELDNSTALYQGNKSPTLEKKIKLTIKLMARLNEESKISDEFDPEKRFPSHNLAA